MEILYSVIAFLIGGSIAWLRQSARLRAEIRVLADRNTLLEGSLKEAKDQATEAQGKVLMLTGTLATAQADLANAKKMQTRLKTEFENLANRR